MDTINLKYFLFFPSSQLYFQTTTQKKHALCMLMTEKKKINSTPLLVQQVELSASRVDRDASETRTVPFVSKVFSRNTLKIHCSQERSCWRKTLSDIWLALTLIAFGLISKSNQFICYLVIVLYKSYKHSTICFWEIVLRQMGAWTDNVET